MADALTITHVCKAYGQVTAIDDVSFTVKDSEIVSLVGPSGCGKSTLLRILAGLDRRYSGAAAIADEPVNGPSPRVGMIFQEPRLMPWLTVRDNMGFGLRGKVHPTDVQGIAEQVGLGGFLNALPNQLSGGMAQRAAIARALVTRPSVLLLDEPFSAVDAFTRMHLQDLLLTIAAQFGTTMLLVTHDVDEALYVSDRVLVMSPRPGRVQAEIAIPEPRPRDRRSPVVARLRAEVLTALFHEVVTIPQRKAISPWF